MSPRTTRPCSARSNWTRTRCSWPSAGWTAFYDSDPNLNPDAARFTRLTYDEALAVGVRIMDTSAFVLANEQSLTMHVFDVAAAGVMREICEGAEHGTRISVK